VVVGVGSWPGDDEDPEPSVRGSDFGRANALPARVIPEIGQLSENSSECPQRPTVSVSHTPVAGFQVAVGRVVGVGTEQSSHVLHHDETRAELVDGVGEVRPQAAAGVGADAGALAVGGHVLAGEPAAQHVHGLDGGPVHGGDVTEVGHVGVAVGEDLAGARVDLGHPRDLTAEDGLDAGAKAAIAGEELSDPHAAHPSGAVR
jgi:hypothetical protein